MARSFCGRLFHIKFICLAEAESEAATIGVDAQNTKLELYAFMQARLGIHARCEFRQMDESLDAIFNASKGSKWRNFGDRACDYLARGVTLLHSCPGIDLCTLDGERNLLFVFIDAEHLHFDLLANV